MGPHTRDPGPDPFPLMPHGIQGQQDRRLILQLVTPEKKEQGIEGEGGATGTESQPVN